MPRIIEQLRRACHRRPHQLSEQRPQQSRELLDAVTTPRVVDVLDEVNQLEPHENKKRLLYHQFRAQVKELIGLPFHTYAMALRAEPLEPLNLQLHDDLYKSSNVLERCQRAIDIAKDAIEHARFTKEKQQMHTLLTALTEEVTGWEMPLLQTLAAPDTPPATDILTTSLKQVGWQSAPQLFSHEVAWQFKLKPHTDCWVGPKFLYIMPHSPVHKGWQAMYVIAQPAYLPETNQWIVLQDQHMTKADWPDYDDVLETASGENQPIYTRELETDREDRVMQQCVQLDSRYQTQSADDTFLDLVYVKQGKDQQARQLQAKQQHLLQTYDHLEKTFDLHANYLLEILDLENEWEPTWTPAKKERLFQAYLNTFSSFYHQKTISHKQVNGWLKTHAKQYADATARQQPHLHRDRYRQLASVFSPWVLLKIESQLECNLLAIPSLMMKQVMSPGILQALQMKTLTFDQLKSVIGEERAGRWKLGTCVACGENNVWIGDKTSGKECDVCLSCEMRDNAGLPIGPGHTHDQQPKTIHPGWQNLRHKAGLAEVPHPFLSNNTIGLGQMVATLL